MIMFNCGHLRNIQKSLPRRYDMLPDGHGYVDQRGEVLRPEQVFCHFVEVFGGRASIFSYSRCMSRIRL